MTARATACHVTGTVVDQDEGACPGAQVRLGRMRTCSNADGRFFLVVPVGRHSLWVEQDGYRPWAYPLAVSKIMTDLAIKIRLVAALLLVLLGGQAAQAQTAPAPDPLAVRPLAQVWLGAQSTYAPGAARQDVAVGQTNLLAAFGRWGAGVRLRTMGAVGTYRPDTPATFAAAELYVAVHRNLVGLQGGITAAPVVFAGYALPLETMAGVPPKLARTMTAMGGLRLDGPTWRAEVGLGVHQQLPGFAVGASVHIEMTAHSATVVDVAAGSKRAPITAPTPEDPNPALWPSYVASVSLVIRP